ncbi:purine-cytosine permease family protein [Mycolicibacterium sp. CBM1]
MANEQVATTDVVGRIEEAGIECLPEEGRTSRPRNLFYVFVGLNFSWAVVVYGWLPMTFGLTFSSAAVSMTLGIVAGSLLTMWVALLGPRTGTNMAVSSGAHYGINGRLIGTGLTVVGTLVYTAVTVWTSGDAVVASGHRLFGLADNNWVRAITYGVITVLFIVIALYGHATIVATQKVIAVVVGVALAVGVFAYAGTFDATRTSGEYALGSYWQTWLLSFVLGVAGPVSYATIIGDYSRRISRTRFSDRQVLTAIAGGLIVGEVVPMVFGMFTAAAFVQTSDSYMFDLVNNAPSWYVLPILVVGVLGGLGQGVTSMYGTGLDLESLLARLSRIQTTIIAAVLSIVLVYLGVFAFDVADAFTAATVFLNAITVPWVAVLVIAAIRNRHRAYDLHDLQAFAQGRHGGRYWFTGGWNLPAVIAWLSGAVVGTLAVNTGSLVMPLADVAGGIDLTTLGSGLIAILVYGIAIVVMPDRVDAPAIPLVAGSAVAVPS